MSIFWGELIGTMILVLLGNGVVANVLLTRTKGHNSGWIVISAGWGFAVAMAVYITGWASGGHYNPAVTLGFCIAKKTAWDLIPLYLSGQFIGALLGAVLVWFSYFPHWQKTPDPQMKLLSFATQPAIRNYTWNFVCELIGTFVLLLGVLGIFDMHNGIASGMGPYAVGILIFAIGLSLGGPTGYAINPVRDLGPRIAYAVLPIKGKGSADWAYSWIPIVAPLLGGALGALIYLLYIQPLKAFL
ncbi:MAG: aquaporin family protein [Verrucomicrobia bacterium]|nr:aquaporin family protein [Verrucomicrobiota bacterium]